jgi:hypothetical protein
VDLFSDNRIKEDLNMGPGKILIKIDDDILRAVLFNFDKNKAMLKVEHQKLLTEAVGPVLRDGGFIMLMGLASTTGNALLDYRLGLARELSVRSFLVSRFGHKFKFTKELSFGKTMALAFAEAHLAGGTADNVESDLWRAVWIKAWSKSTFPPPADSKVDIPFANKTWVADVGKANDTLAMTLGILDLIADIAEVAAVAAPLADLVFSTVGGIVAMPAIWATGDAYANTNGQIQGSADAIQDMADQFSDASLETTPLSKWPRVTIPVIHTANNAMPNAFEQAWRSGQATGRNNAMKAVINLEQEPKPIELKNGDHIRLTGRMWLRALSLAFKDNAGIEVVVKPANEKLNKKGKPPFPTHP